MITATMLCLIVGAALYSIVSGLINYEDKKLNGQDGLFETSATILAFSTLGSVLGIRFSSDKDRGMAQVAMLSIIILCTTTVIVLQAVVIVGLCCFDLYASTYIGVMSATVGCFIVMAFMSLLFIFTDTYSDSELKGNQPSK